MTDRDGALRLPLETKLTCPWALGWTWTHTNGNARKFTRLSARRLEQLTLVTALNSSSAPIDSGQA
jgi:hypothetical protein